MNKKMRIAVVLVDRANYGRLKPVMLELKNDPRVDLKVVCSGTMLLDRFGKAKTIVAADGFEIEDEVYMELDGSVPATMAKSIGLGVVEFSTTFQRMKPDFVLIIGDRYEALAAAIAAAYQNLCLIHLQGGEISGSIDESARHAITKLSHFHFPATKRSGEYIIAMGERPDTVFPLGCPSADVIVQSAKELPKQLLEKRGVGNQVDVSKPYILVLFHPVTTEFGNATQQMHEVLKALHKTSLQIILLWPNIDAGADDVSEAIRRFREFNPDAPLHAYKNFEPELYIPVLARAACAVGNSSSFIRDASFLGTPIVLVGSRQDGREWCDAVTRVEATEADVSKAIEKQLKKARYSPSDLYGAPGVSKKIVEQIVQLKPYSQKRLHYPFR